VPKTRPSRTAIAVRDGSWSRRCWVRLHRLAENGARRRTIAGHPLRVAIKHVGETCFRFRQKILLHQTVAHVVGHAAQQRTAELKGHAAVGLALEPLKSFLSVAPGAARGVLQSLN